MNHSLTLIFLATWNIPGQQQSISTLTPALTPFARQGIGTKAKKYKEGGLEEGFRGEKGGRKATRPVSVDCF